MRECICPLPQFQVLYRLVAQRPTAPGAALALSAAPLTKTYVLLRFAVIWLKPTPAKQTPPFQFHDGLSSWRANAPKRRLPNARPEGKAKMSGMYELRAATGGGEFYAAADVGIL
jgi:hypothetical protein